MAENLEALDALLDEQRDAWEAGECPSIESLLDNTPFREDREFQLDLLYHEVVLREGLGQSPQLEEYVERYPELQQELALHFEIHQAVCQLPDDATDVPHTEMTIADEGAARDPAVFPSGYDRVEWIGQGGMAVVYRARDTHLHRDVALKMFRPAWRPTERDRQRWNTEAEALARLSHPNILQIYAIGEVAGTPYLALEYAERGTLAQRLQQFRYEPRAAAELVITLARAVAVAHEQQVIHRDLKPANVLFTRDGTPKLSDFGLAKVLESQRADQISATLTGEPLGTPRYMAPEQAAGETARIGPATDVYGLGTLLYECLTGQAPFVSTSVVETLQRIRTEDPLPPRRSIPKLPRDLETICLQALQKSPNRRYQSAAALADDLERALRNEPIRARAISLFERGAKWCRRQPARAALLAVLILLSSGTAASFAANHYWHLQEIARLRSELDQQVVAGRQALDEQDVDRATGHFESAWRIVQSDAALHELETSVSGWLYHCRKVAQQSRWTDRVPPRDFDDRRDEALILAGLQLPWFDNPVAEARLAILEALELTLPGSITWSAERERLLLLDAMLLAYKCAPEEGLELLGCSPECHSRPAYLLQEQLAQQLNQNEAAERARLHAEKFPPQPVLELYFSALDHLRAGRWEEARSGLDRVLMIEPEHFLARLLLGRCALELGTAREAQVALTAAIAQRPRCAWAYLFRSQSAIQQQQYEDAARDLETALKLHPSEAGRFVLWLELGRLRTRLGQFEEARKALQMARELRPQAQSVAAAFRALPTTDPASSGP